MSATTTLTTDDFKVADLSLASYGRHEITLAEHEMPGLMAIRNEFADADEATVAAVRLYESRGESRQAILLATETP